MIVALVVAGALVIVGAAFLGGYVGERHSALAKTLNEAQLAEMSRINVTLNRALDAARRSEVALGEHNHVLTEKLVQAEAHISTLEGTVATQKVLVDAWSGFMLELAGLRTYDAAKADAYHSPSDYAGGWRDALVQVRTLVRAASAGDRPATLGSVLEAARWLRALLVGTRMEACLRNDAAEGAKLDEVDALLGSFVK